MRSGLATEFRSEKIPRNRLGMVSVILQKKVLILRHSEDYGRDYSEARNANGMKKISFTKNPAPANRIDSIFSSETCLGTEFQLLSLPRNGSEQNSKCLLIFLFHGTEFRVVFSSAEWFRTEFREFASIFVPQYRIHSIFLLFGTVPNGIPRVFCSAEKQEFRRNKPIVPSIPASAE